MPTPEEPIYIVLVEDTYYPSGGTYDWEFATGDLERAKHYAQAKLGKYGYATVARVQRLSDGSIYFDTVVTYESER